MKYGTFDTTQLVCPCNQVNDFPQPCPWHGEYPYGTTAPAPSYGTYTYQVYPAAWECPRCAKMNAPHANQCSCDGNSSAGEEIKTTTAATAECSGCYGNGTSCRAKILRDIGNLQEPCSHTFDAANLGGSCTACGKSAVEIIRERFNQSARL
jgi:hypothetical protein